MFEVRFKKRKKILDPWLIFEMADVYQKKKFQGFFCKNYFSDFSLVLPLFILWISWFWVGESIFFSLIQVHHLIKWLWLYISFFSICSDGTKKRLGIFFKKNQGVGISTPLPNFTMWKGGGYHTPRGGISPPGWISPPFSTIVIFIFHHLIKRWLLSNSLVAIFM